MENKLIGFELKNFINRVISAIFFIPLIIVPIILEGYFLFLIYIFILSFISIEIVNMIKISKIKVFLYIYLLVCVFTFFLFIITISSIDNISFLIIEMILIIWLFDTFCYLGGKTLNGKKLMPNISKGKTYNGLFTGTIATLVISGIYYVKVYNELEFLFILVIPTIILSFLGDLLVSVLKRSVNLKDSGQIMPGHGGIVDRMDSFILVFFFFGVFLLIFI